MGTKNLKRAALDAVAKRFSATVADDGHLLLAGKRVAVEFAILKRQGHVEKTQLRFDKVVIRLMGRLQAALGKTVPDGMTVLLTVTAPIRLPSKTAGVLDEKILALLRRKSADKDEKETIHGNRVQIRLLRMASKQAPKLIGFVHNPESDPLPSSGVPRGA